LNLTLLTKECRYNYYYANIVYPPGLTVLIWKISYLFT
jgi:hypothetical protein